MPTVAHLVKKAIRDNNFLIESLAKGIISHPALAEELHNEIEKELGKKVKLSAIVMALRRYEEELEQQKKKTEKKLHGEIILKTNIIDINVTKSPNLATKLKQLYSIASYEKGDTLNIILGNNEVAIITNEKHSQKVLDFLKNEKIVTKQTNLVSLTMNFDSQAFLKTPGIIFAATRKLSWEGINILEIISTMHELTFILHQKDSMKAYTVLGEMFK